MGAFDNLTLNAINRGCTELIDINLTDSMVLNPYLLEQKLSNIRELSNEEIENIIRIGYKKILDDTINNCKFAILFTNTRFLAIFSKVIKTIALTPLEVIYINTIVYDYIDRGNTVQEIKKMMLGLLYVIDRPLISKLEMVGLDSDFALYVAMYERSTTKQIVAVQRVNFFITILGSLEYTTEQKIIQIYEALYDKISLVFIGCMLESAKQYRGDVELVIYSRITSAILTIVNQMPLTSIRQILIDYYNHILSTPETDLRCSLKYISPSYNRILSIISGLEMEGILIY